MWTQLGDWKPETRQISPEHILRVLHGNVITMVGSASQQHHAMPQRFQRDFDMEHLPVTAVHEDFVYDPENIAQNNVLTRNQGFLLPLNGTLFICAINFYYHPHYIFKRVFGTK
ncbi:hypothetical protein Ocin01_11995 [Orchesella cincta]|uniref:Uncharacterized protein n=1 Tax=Orchesella cincta TaxID=48709 RepID=A0A1D2MNX2_ORCCI|nr:hypothetical protein Ocin01_11995 [Orchesella cincta]